MTVRYETGDDGDTCHSDRRALQRRCREEEIDRVDGRIPAASNGIRALRFARHLRYAPSLRDTNKFSITMRVRILYHDHCFDGAASAAFFSRMAADKFYPGAEFCFTGMAHKASQLFEPGLFDGDVNAIVDFKYSDDPRVTWWFDHHQSAFLSPEDAAHFRRDTSGRKMFDPTFRSCTNVHRDDRARKVRATIPRI